MKVVINIIESYKPGTDEVFIRLNALLLKHKHKDDFTPIKEFCIGWKKDYAVESEKIIESLRQLADKIEQNAKTSS